MISQLHTTIYRITRYKSTWIMLFFPCIWGIFCVLSTYLSETMYDSYSYSNSKQDIRNYLIHGVLVSAVFVYLLIDRERGDGGWRNKITVGVKRHWIFLSSWLVSVVFSVVSSSLEIFAVKGIVSLLGRTGDKIFKIPDTRTLVLIMFWTVALSSLFVLVDAYFSIRFFSLVLTLFMLFAFMMIGIQCRDRLEIPYTECIYNEETDEYIYQENPNYVTGNARRVLTYISDRSPETAFYGEVTKHVFKIQRDITIVLFIAGVAIGVPAFKRKEII